MKIVGDDYKKLKNMKKNYEKAEMSMTQVRMLKRSIEDAKREKEQLRRRRTFQNLAAAAAAAAIFVLLPNTSQSVAHAMSSIPIIGELVKVVTFRDYQYEDARHKADITVPELVADADLGAGYANTGEGEADSQQNREDAEKIQENITKSAEEINAEIRAITEPFIEEFEENLKLEDGYQDVLIESEIVSSTQDYFTLKLIVYQGAGSGMQWNYFYTIDLNTGERLALKDLFLDGADYITAISDNIKEQMRAQMATDENLYYWLEDEIEAWNFKSITDETSFYVNKEGNIVINFNEGDVAPMYMGVVEFEIPAEALAGLRK